MERPAARYAAAPQTAFPLALFVAVIDLAPACGQVGLAEPNERPET